MKHGRDHILTFVVSRLTSKYVSLTIKFLSMKKVACLIFLSALITSKSYTQFKLSPEQQRRWDSIQQVTQQDYRKMLNLLHIDSTRPGPSGNPQAPNAA